MTYTAEADAPHAQAVPTVDWRSMFWQYIENVGRHEGVSFLYEYDFTESEWAAIVRLCADHGTTP